MRRFYTLGLDIYFETVEDEVIFAYNFKEALLQTRFDVSDNVRILAEETKEWEYTKQLNRRVSYFNRKFK